MTARAWRRLASWLGALARWCYERSQPLWAIGMSGIRYRGRRLGPMPPPWKAIVRADPCVYCGQPSDTLEHVHPKAKGGAWGWQNEVGACKACNNAKGDRLLLVFLLQRHREIREAERQQALKARPFLTRRQRQALESQRRMAQPPPRGRQSGGHR